MKSERGEVVSVNRLLRDLNGEFRGLDQRVGRKISEVKAQQCARARAVLGSAGVHAIETAQIVRGGNFQQRGVGDGNEIVGGSVAINRSQANQFQKDRR